MSAKKGSLIIAGTGIKLISHITEEVKLAIKTANLVYYISPVECFGEYMEDLNQNALSLNYLYKAHQSRAEVYNQMKRVVVDAVESGKNVCFVFYGHPCVVATPGLLAVKELKAKEYQCMALPGVSSLDCIFSDLLIDPSEGLTCYEATDLVYNHKEINTKNYNVIWQPYMFSCEDSIPNDDDKLSAFVQYLLKFYVEDKIIGVYSASFYPGDLFAYKEIFLKDISKKTLNIESTIIIPPICDTL